MLTEALLEEFSQDTPFTERLVRLAWPALSTESKMQLIAASQGGGWQLGGALRLKHTPGWLTDLALDDKEPIVQYLALRGAYLKTRPDHPMLYADPVTDVEQTRYEKAHSISHELVRAALRSVSPFRSGEQFAAFSHLERLAAIRNAESIDLGTFLVWLSDGVAAGTPDEELVECTWEFWHRQTAKEELRVSEPKSSDFENAGLSEYLENEAMKEGWQLIKRVGPALQRALYVILPTEAESGAMKAEDLAAMPPTVLDLLVRDLDPTEPVRDVQQIVACNPQRFPAELVERARNTRRTLNELQLPPFDKGRSADYRRLMATNQTRQILEVVLELRKRLDEINEELAAMKKNLSIKRGFFS